MKLIFAGTPQNAAHTLEKLLLAGHQVAGVVSRPDAPVGRKQIISESPVATVAKTHGIPLIKTKKITHDQKQILDQWAAELGVVVAYGSIFDTETLLVPKLGWLNIHYSLLPKWPGAAPVQNTLLNGDTKTGVTIFKLDEGIDTGLIARQVEIDVLEDETSGELLSRLTVLGAEALLEVLKDFETGAVDLVKQDSNAGCETANKPNREIAKIAWQLSSEKIHNLIRAMNPEPMSWCLHEENILRVIKAKKVHSNENFNVATNPGTVEIQNKKVFVHCGGNTLLELIEIQPAGKKPMRALDWINGLTNRNVVLS